MEGAKQSRKKHFFEISIALTKALREGKNKERGKLKRQIGANKEPFSPPNPFLHLKGGREQKSGFFCPAVIATKGWQMSLFYMFAPYTFRLWRPLSLLQTWQRHFKVHIWMRSQTIFFPPFAAWHHTFVPRYISERVLMLFSFRFFQPSREPFSSPKDDDILEFPFPKGAVFAPKSFSVSQISKFSFRQLSIIWPVRRVIYTWAYIIIRVAMLHFW